MGSQKNLWVFDVLARRTIDRPLAAVATENANRHPAYIVLRRHCPMPQMLKLPGLAELAVKLAPAEGGGLKGHAVAVWG